jgi:hypothetical protein
MEGDDEYDDNGNLEQVRVAPAAVISTLTVGQTTTVLADYYTNGTYVGPASLSLKLVGISSVTVPKGTYDNCLHVVINMSVSGNQGAANEEWWAFGIGVVKEIHKDHVWELAYTSISGPPPAVTIVAPTNGQSFTNALCPVSGTVSGAAAGVFCRAGDSAWVEATGTNNWSATLTLAPGTNIVGAYAVDAAGNPSATNSVTLILDAQVPLDILGLGTVKVVGGGLNRSFSINAALWLVPGQSYRFTASAGHGFSFAGWTSNGISAGKSDPLAFVVASNLALTAIFADITPPKCVVTYPAAGHSVSNSPMTAMCRASDNVGVVALYYQLNGAAWQSESVAASLDGTNWPIADLALKPGANTLAVWATDAAGNCSKTNSVKFTYVPPASLAPASLSGLVGTVVGSMGDSGTQTPFELSFGVSTYALTATNANEAAEVGNYAYTLLSSNTAQVSTIAVLPPGSTQTRIFTFTNSTICVFTNADGSLGYVTFAQAANIVPSPSAGFVSQHWFADGSQLSTTVFSEGLFTNYSDYGTSSETPTSWGTYTFEPFSPVSAVVQMSFTNDANAGMTVYDQLTYSTPSTGTWYAFTLNSLGGEDYVASGVFERLSSTIPPAGHAPMTIAGTSWALAHSDSSDTGTISFGASTYTATGSVTNAHHNNVGDYIFMKTGANTGLWAVSPMLLSGTGASIGEASVFSVTFTSATSASYTGTNSDGSVGTGAISIAAAKNYAPTSVAGKTLGGSGGGNSIVFGADGTFTSNGSGGGGTYTYSQFSPVGGMVVLTHSFDGHLSFFQLTFTSATAGSSYRTGFNADGSLEGIAVGAFTLK